MATEKLSFIKKRNAEFPLEVVNGAMLVNLDTGAAFVDDSELGRVQIKDTTKVSSELINAANGIAGLDENGKVIADLIPSSGSENTISISDAGYLYSADRISVAGYNDSTAIPDNAYSGCTGITSLMTLPSGIVSIGNNAFSGCTGLTSIFIPGTVTSIGYNAFSGCSSDLKIYCIKGSAAESYAMQCGIDYESMDVQIEDGILIIPEGSTTLTVAKYGNVSGIRGIKMANSVTDIESGAFDNFSGLPVYITAGSKSSGVTALENYADSNDYTYTLEVTIPSSTTTIPLEAFKGCTSITSLIIPDTVTSFAKDSDGYSYAFYNCTNLRSIVIGNSIEWLYKGSFCGCTSLINIQFGSSISMIMNAFEDCTSLESVVIPNNVGLQGFIVVYGVRGGPFKDCSKLKYIKFAGTIPLLSGFMYCTGLETLTVPEGPEGVNNSALAGCINLRSIALPSTITWIGPYAFSNCSSLESIVIPKNVTQIDAYAFESCTELQNITIPGLVTQVSNYAFYKCTALTDVVFECAELWIGTNIFSGCTNLTTVTVPKNFCLTNSNTSERVLILSMSTKLTVASIVAMFENLKDLTGSTASTITLGSTNLAKLTDEQKAIATDKNWKLN